MIRILALIIALVEVALPQVPYQPIKLRTILEVASSDSGEQLGAYVKGVGDLNNDGYADVAVSAPGIYKTFVYYGAKTMSQTPSLTLEGGGNIISGDFRGNGWIDLAIEIPFHDTVLVYYNGPQGLDTIPDLILTMPSDYFGQVMTVGDFFGNGYTDLAIGTMDANTWPDTLLEGRGRIFIYAGGTDFNATPADTIVGDTIRAGLGHGLAAGEVYGDGKDELVALGFNQSCNNVSCAYDYFSVYYNDVGFHMKRCLYVDSRHVPGGFGPDYNGTLACFDADGDGIKDILVSGICIFKGGTRIDTLPTYRVAPPNNDTLAFGAYPRVSGGGDYDGNGIPDILLASTSGGAFGMAPGVFVMVDSKGQPGKYAGYRVYSDYLGSGVDLSGAPENAGDVNGAGVDDIIIANGGWFYPKDYGFFGIYSGDSSMIAGVKEPKRTPEEFELNQNYPNPFNPSTAISYQLSVTSDVTLRIYDVLGREVRTLINNENETAGNHVIQWDGIDSGGHRVGSGIYFYRLTTQNGEETKKAVYLK